MRLLHWQVCCSPPLRRSADQASPAPGCCHHPQGLLQPPQPYLQAQAPPTAWHVPTRGRWNQLCVPGNKAHPTLVAALDHGPDNVNIRILGPREGVSGVGFACMLQGTGPCLLGLEWQQTLTLPPLLLLPRPLL